MAYPMVMMVLATGVTIFLLTYIMPKFAPLFKAKGTKLPGPTVVMMSVSDNLLAYWYVWLAVIAAAHRRLPLRPAATAQGKRAIDWLKISLP